MSFDVILWNAFTGVVSPPKVVLRRGVTLLSSLAIPFEGFGVILWDATAIVVHPPEVVLRRGVALLRGEAGTR